MIDFTISWLPVATLTVANFILSWVYYSPMVPWFKAWQKGVGMDPNKKEMTEQEKKEFPGIMIGAVVASFLISYGLQVIVHSFHAADFVSGAVLGLVAWVTFTVTHSLNTRFEGRKVSVLIINNVWYLLTYAVFGGIFAVWK